VGGNWCASPFPHRYVFHLTCQLLCINVFTTYRLVSTQQGGQHPPCCIENTFKTVRCSLPRLRRETEGPFVLHPPFSPPHFHALSTSPAEHRNHAHLGTFSMLCICPPPPHPPTILNIETMPIWARFRCLVSVHHFLTCEHRKIAQMGMVSMLGVCQLSRTSKLCPFGHVFDAWHLSTTSPPVEHRKSAQMGTFSILGIYPPPPHPPSICPPSRTSKLYPFGHIFNARYLSTTTPPAEHRKNAQMSTFSMLSARPLHPHPPNIKEMPRWARFRCSGCPPLPHPPNIKTVPIWTRFRCSACVRHIPTRRP